MNWGLNPLNPPAIPTLSTPCLVRTALVSPTFVQHPRFPVIITHTGVLTLALTVAYTCFRHAWHVRHNLPQIVIFWSLGGIWPCPFRHLPWRHNSESFKGTDMFHSSTALHMLSPRKVSISQTTLRSQYRACTIVHCASRGKKSKRWRTR